MLRVLCLLSFSLCLVSTLLAHAATDSVNVTGDVQKSLTLAVQDLIKHDAVTVDLHEKDGSMAKYKGVQLFDLLKDAGVAAGDHPGKAMAIMVTVVASDGYQVVFGLGELTPTISGRTIILAYEADGKPLGPNAGPFRLVIAGDKMPARCIRMVTEIRVTQLRKSELN